MTDMRDLIDHLSTLAGMIMEDTSPIAISPDPPISDFERIATLREAAADIASIVAATERWHDAGMVRSEWRKLGRKQTVGF